MGVSVLSVATRNMSDCVHEYGAIHGPYYFYETRVSESYFPLAKSWLSMASAPLPPQIKGEFFETNNPSS